MHMDIWHYARATSLSANLVPIIVYAMGPRRTPNALTEIFRYVQEAEVGDVYFVTTHSAPEPFLWARKRVKLRTALPPELSFTSTHYSAPWTLWKVDVLSHVPRHVQRLVTLDLDTIIGANFTREMGAHIDSLRPPAFAALSPSSSDGLYSGVQGGLVGWDLRELRRQTLCPHATWWSCVNTSASPGLPLGEQSLWDIVMRDQPRHLRLLPCGLHLETQLLQWVSRELGLATAKQYPAAAACPARLGQPSEPQVVHSAAGMGPMAARVARKLFRTQTSRTVR